MKTHFRNLLYLILAFLNILSLSSCSEDEQLDTNPLKSTYKEGLMTYHDYIAEMARPMAPGTVLIQNNSTIYYQQPEEEDKGIIVSATTDSPMYPIHFFDDNGKPLDIINSTDSQLTNRLYGKDLKYSIDNKSYSLYTPQLLYVKEPDYVLKPGSTITWNTDPKNEKGVLIWLTYKPTTQMRWDIMEKNRNYITEGWAVADKGSYVITEKNLERLPNGAQINLFILRTNFTYHGSKKPSIIAYSMLSTECLLQK